MSIENYTDKELNEAMEAARDCYGDTLSQHRAEVAGFGDSWPGAEAQIERMRAAMVELEREHSRRHSDEGAVEAEVEVEVDYDDSDDSDIPF